jgi:hypothetical protein
MLAAASRRGAAALARSALQSRFVSTTQQTRALHTPRPSPLLHHNVHPRTQNVLPALARASVPFVFQSRGLYASALPRFVFKAFRVPAGGLAIFTGGFAYINYKVQGLTVFLECGELICRGWKLVQEQDGSGR